MPKTLSEIRRVLICDDHPIFVVGMRSWLSPFLSQQTVVESHFDCESALIRLKSDPFDLLILDLHLPGVGGLEVLRQTRKHSPDLPVIVITSTSERLLLQSVEKCGANAILTKSHDPTTFFAALNHVIGGETPHAFLEEAIQNYIAPVQSGELTPREWEVLALIARGLRNADIAAQLHCSVETVKTHRVKIGQKTQTRNRAELTAWFLQREH